MYVLVHHWVYSSQVKAKLKFVHVVEPVANAIYLNYQNIVHCTVGDLLLFPSTVFETLSWHSKGCYAQNNKYI